MKFLFKFFADLNWIEKEVLQPNVDQTLIAGELFEDHITVFIDFSIEWNPFFNQKKEEKSIMEM